jgi:hypothetical protein
MRYEFRLGRKSEWKTLRNAPQGLSFEARDWLTELEGGIMFGMTRRRATRTAVEAVLPFIRVLKMTDGIPDGFWDDPYVLGIVSGSISIFAKLSTNGRIAGDDLGAVLIDTFSIISEQDGVPIIRRVLAFQDASDPDFLLGVKNADKMVSYAYGDTGYDNDPDVIHAKRIAKATASLQITGPISPDAAIAGALQQILFYDMVRKRLDRKQREQDAVARKSIEAAKLVGAKDARQAAEITMGRPLSNQEWEKCRTAWERNWH